MLPKAAFSTVTLAPFLFVLASPAAGQKRPFHVEANVGQASVDDIDGFTIDDSTTALRLGTGYRFADWLGIDAAFVDLGNVESTIALGGGAPVSVEASGDGFELTLSGRLPVTDALYRRPRADLT